MKRILFTLFLLLTASKSFADPKGYITEKGVKNVGSGIGYMSLCERDKYLPIGTATDYIKVVKNNLNPAQAEQTIRVFQLSLTDKKMYSPSRDEWFKMNVNKTECEKIERTIPSLVYFLESLNK